MSHYSAKFQCFSGCDGSYPVTTAIYRCPKCGGLLEVKHDMAALKDRSAAAWMRLFDERYMRTSWPYGSGVWGKREWVMPMVTDDAIVSTGEGGTNLFWAERLGKQVDVPDLWIKQCGNAHTGSFKDLGMTVLVSVVRHGMLRGELNPRAIACASTGDTSAALAAYGAAAGLPVVVLLPRGKVSTAQLVQPLAHGAKVLQLETDFDGCMEIIQKLAAEGLVYLANSMNPLRIEGQKTVAIEMVQQFDWEVPDWVVIPSGNLGNASALHAGFEMMRELGVIQRLPRLLVAQAANADPMYQAYVAGNEIVAPIVAKQSHASAIQIGNPVSAPRAMRALKAMNGVVEEATEQELADACARADRTGLYTCPHTGVALACVFKLREKGVIQKSDRVLVVSTANGLKFTEFKRGYHEKAFPELDSRLRNEPVVLPANVDAVKAALA